ncbi:MAG TPA: endonuclease III [Phycisphaerae bacterium]|nr:endonuclease III [Phycisphaerae bacterium]
MKPARDGRTPLKKPVQPLISAAGEPIDAKKKRARQIVARLKKLYTDADCALEHGSPLQLLVATILSAQCTDVRVNMVTPVLFKRYPNVEALANADASELEKVIQSTGFFRNKTRNIIGAARTIRDRFNGRVPDTMAELLELPGVARKTANVVLGTWFEKNEGFVVDTHVGRLAHRLGLTWQSKDNKDAVKIERDLMEIVPRDEWTFLGHALIWHGRKICTARKPNCAECVLNDICPSAFRAQDDIQPPVNTESKARTPKTTGALKRRRESKK